MAALERSFVEEVLRETLADGRLSRGERQALAEVLGERVTGPRDADLVRAAAFAIAAEVARYRSDDALTWLEQVMTVLLGVVRPDADEVRCEAFFSPGSTCVEQLVRLLDRASLSVAACVFTVTDDRLSDALVRCHRRSVRVRLITDDDKAWDPGSDVARLVDEGVAVAVDTSPAHMHHKFVVVDGRLVATGSYNWTRSAARSNQENLVLCDHPDLVRQFSEEFERLWLQFEGAR